ncbi:MAG: hypothetical protein ACKPKO_29070, partial [Candidatus Fonsibacter sp.]
DYFLNDVLDESRVAIMTPPRSRVSSHPPLAPPVHPPGPDASVESQVDASMRELMAKNDQVKSMEALAKGREEFAFLAEARLRAGERAFYFESENNEVVVSMAKEVGSGQYSVLRQVESKLH